MEQQIEFGEAGERSGAPSYLMPAITFQPLLLAFGLMLIFGGLIVYRPLSYLGVVLALVAAVGWWRRVIPEEEHELLPVDVMHRPGPIAVNQRSVARLKVGDAQHRVQIPEETHPYSAGILGGLAGGVAMAVLAVLYGLIAQHSIWYPVNLLAGVVLPGIGDASLDQLRAFNGAAFVAALGGHLALSILVGVLYAVVLPMFPKYAPFWAGILMPLIWSGVVATLLNFLNPALNDRISWPWFVCCQLGFGLVCGYIIARSARIKTRQPWTLAERASLDAPGLSPERRDNHK
jgi:hypothetical protein